MPATFPKLTTLISPLLTLIVGVWEQEIATGQDFELTGMLVQEVFPLPGKKEKHPELTFTVAVKGNQWHVKFLQENGLEEYATGIGDTVYQLRVVDPRVPVKENGSVGEVFPGGYPFNTVPGTSIPWFVWASGDYLTKHANRVPCLPIHSALGDAEAFFYQSEIVRSTEAPFLPALARFVAGSPLWRKVLAHQDGVMPYRSYRYLDEPAYQRYFKAITNGTLGATYEVTAWTNFEHQVLPSRFLFTKLLLGEGKAEPRTFFQWRGELKSVSKCTRPSMLPEIPAPGTLWVNDYRFRDQKLGIESIQYEFTNGWPIELPSGKALLEAKRQYVIRSNTNPADAARRRVTLELTAASLGLLIAAAYLRRSVRKARERLRAQGNTGSTRR